MLSVEAIVMIGTDWGLGEYEIRTYRLGEYEIRPYALRTRW